MGKKNNEKKAKETIEEVDVEALNAEAEDLIGDGEGSDSSSEEAEANSASVSDGQSNVGPTSDEDPEAAEEAAGREAKFLGFHPISKEKVYG